MSSSKDRTLRAAPALAGAAIVAMLPALVGGGCAAPNTQYPQANWYAGGPRPAQVDPEAVVAAAKAAAPPKEDDGLPAQLPPRLGARLAPDDPSQPWSPNYGGPALKRAASQSQAATTAQDRDAMQALQGIAARQVSWQRGN